MKRKAIWCLVLPLFFVAGCQQTVKDIKDSGFKGPVAMQKQPTTGFVSDNASMYTNSLSCIGQLITQSGQAGSNGITMSVGMVQDRTGKELDSSPLTQAASEMTLTALSRVGAIDLVGATDMRDILQYNLSGTDPQKIATEVAVGSIGSIIQSHAFISGAITEYNENIRTRRIGWDIFRIFGLGGSTDDSVINVAVDLRVVNSRSGRVLRSRKGKLLVVSLQNNIASRGYDGSVFRGAGSFYGDAHYNLRVADPKHLAVREIIEKGVMMLVGELYNVNWQSCDKVMPPPRMQPPQVTQNGVPTTSTMTASTGLGDF